MVLDKTSGIMFPCKSPAQTLYPHQQQPQQQEETRGRGILVTVFKLCLNTTICIFTYFFTYKYFHKI